MKRKLIGTTFFVTSIFIITLLPLSSALGAVDPSKSSVSLSDGGLTTCPAGDGPIFQSLIVQVLDNQSIPIVGIPVTEFDIVIGPTNLTDWSGNLSATFVPLDNMTNLNGTIQFEVIGDTSIIGELLIRVSVLGTQLDDIALLPCNSFDMDVNGFIGLQDFARFASDYGGTAQRSDFNWDGRVDLVDFAMFASHYGH